MTRAEEIAFEKKAEKHFKGQRELPNRRDFRWNQPHYYAITGDKNFRKNFDNIFPNAPGAGI